MDGKAPAARIRPRATVLMATYNGRKWIDEQVDSILGQRGVDVVLVVSDDGSTDGTPERLIERAAADPRIRVLPRRTGEPGVTGNFLHLFTTYVPDGSFVAFSDQDDVWRPDKLEHQIRLLDEGADVVSSNVVSFDERGESRLIEKNGPMRRWDHVFEAAGPGSTYVFSPAIHERLVGVLADLDYSEIGVHDWYLYALARAIGAKWRIDEVPTVEYRQHGGNVQGANTGAAARGARLSRLRSGFYRRQFVLTARMIERVNDYPPELKKDLALLIRELEDGSPVSRARFLRRCGQIRRNRREGLELAVSRLLGVW